jgi:uncharacterized phage-associated protein
MKFRFSFEKKICQCYRFLIGKLCYNNLEVVFMTKVLLVADYFLSLSTPGSKKAITNLKLQKLIYYAQGFHLALFGKPMFNDRIEAWIHGPVSPTVYRHYSHYNYNDISSVNNKIELINTLSNHDKQIIELVWELFGTFTGKELEHKTHEEIPWIEARGNLPEYISSNKEISLKTMEDFFRKSYLGDN